MRASGESREDREGGEVESSRWLGDGQPNWQVWYHRLRCDKRDCDCAGFSEDLNWQSPRWFRKHTAVGLLIKMRHLTRLNALSYLSAAGMILAAASPCWSAEAWQRFRGPGGSGIAVDGDFPIHFGPDSNVVWKTDVPPGSSSPCIWESNLFLTAFNGGKLETICFERSDGTVR